MNLRVKTKFEYAGGFNVDAAFTAEGGTTTALTGPSGSGKSTLLMLIAGLLEPADGSISIGDQVLYCSNVNVNQKPWNRNVGILFQHDTLLPHLSVRKNLMFGGRATSTESYWRFESIVDAFAIGELLDRKPSQLSGGQRDRVALGRTLLSQPQALLLDEPLVSVEESLRNSIFEFVEENIVRSGIPMLLVSHDTALVNRTLGQRLVMSNGMLAD